MKSFASAAVLSACLCGAALAQTGLPSYQGDPSVYKVVFEDQNFRMIIGTWPAGMTDKPHTHPLAFVVYAITDCKQKLHQANGSVVDIEQKAGATMAGIPTPQPHTAENVGTAECRVLFVERK